MASLRSTRRARRCHSVVRGGEFWIVRGGEFWIVRGGEFWIVRGGEFSVVRDGYFSAIRDAGQAFTFRKFTLDILPHRGKTRNLLLSGDYDSAMDA
ncbi:hypothetical protein [Halorussus litoreus]|uniref:hypothetical protein n=1 Tax=Halorussus litoreus TaxID=1710536 RepID=UPI0013006254|nr:hypothetical protein [Halorussus litoreus]